MGDRRHRIASEYFLEAKKRLNDSSYMALLKCYS